MDLTNEALWADNWLIDIIAVDETPTESDPLVELLVGWRNEIREGEQHQYTADSNSSLARLWLANRA